MMVEKSELFKKLIKDEKKSPEYHKSSIQIEFAEYIYNYMKANRYTRAELARRIGVSRQRVTQMLRCDANLTIETMAKIAAALGLELEVTFKKNR